MWKHGPKPVIGLVGGIGAGKSTAAQCFAIRCGYIINADALGHEALRQPDIIARIAERWGESVRKPDGSLDRRAIGRIVFANPSERSALESMVFPYIENRCQEEINRGMTDNTVKFVVLDAAVLFEAGWNTNVDRIVYLDAPREMRLERLLARSGWSETDLTAREAAQWPAEEKKARADAIIVNAAGSTELQEQVDRLLVWWGLVHTE
jgi:dephospho-CoA kinase